MKAAALFGFVCIVCTVVFSQNAPVVELEDHVNVLTDANFNDFISKHEFVLVKFYAPWCGHCKSMAGDYSKVAEDLKEAPYKIAKLDATVNSATAAKYSVSGYPTLLFFIEGKNYVKYSGGRTKDDIISWIFKKTQPTSQELNSVEEVENFKLTNDVVLVFFGNNGFESYYTKTKEIDDVVFGHCKVQACLNHYNAKNGSIVLFKNFDNKRNDLAPFFGVRELKSFIENEGLPLVIHYGNQYEKFFKEGRFAALYFIYNRQESDSELFEKIATEVAPKLKSQFKLKTVLTDIETDNEKKLGETILIAKREQLPLIKIVDTRVKAKRYLFTSKLNSANIIDFANKWFKNRIPAEIKSEDVPEVQGPVVKIVGKTWKEIVHDKSKDVLVKYYAPWCGHCKEIAPIYEDLAKKLNPLNPNLIIADIDATANEFEFEIGSYPTIHFFPASTKKLEAFKGERNIAGFVEFLEKHASFPINKSQIEDL